MRAYLCSAVSLAVLALVVCVAGNAFATTITVAASPPTADLIDIRQTLSDDGSDMFRRADDGNSANHQWFGQTFTVPVGGMIVDRVAYAFSQEVANDRATAGLLMGAVIYNATTLADTSGTVVSSQSALTPSFTQGVVNWMIFDLDDVVLAAGTYGINFDFANVVPFAGPPLGGNAITNDGMRFIGNGNDNYTGGQGWRISGSGANNFNELRDLAFVVTGTPVPEPSTMCLAAGFGLFEVIGMHRRKRIRR